MPSVRGSRLLNNMSPVTHLPSPTLPSMIRITEFITCFSLNACVSARINSLNSLSENRDGDKEDRGYPSL